MTEEDYIRVQDTYGFKEGDMVKVTHKAEDNEGGWDNGWAVEMDDFIGNIYPILKVARSSGVTLISSKYNDKYSFPYYVLQKIEKAPKLKTGVIISCGTVIEEVFFSKELLAEMKAGNKLILNTTKL